MASSLVQSVRSRVRLRSRLRAVRERWHRIVPRRLPRWSGPGVNDPAGTSPTPTRPAGGALTAESIGWLRRYAAGAGSQVVTDRLEVVLERWRAPYPGWSGRLGPLPRLVSHDIRLPERGEGRAMVRVVLAEPVPLPLLVAAILPVLRPLRPLPAPAGPDPVAAPPAGSAAPAGAAVATTAGAAAAAITAGVMTADATAANPYGRQRYGPHLPAGRLRLVRGADGIWWQIGRAGKGTAAGPAAVVVAGRVGELLDERQAAVLAELGVVHCGGDPGAEVTGAAEATVIAQLAMTGVVLYAPGLPDATAALLAPTLTTILRAPLPAGDADPLEWEIRSVQQRRSALRQHATAFALPGVTSAGPPAPRRLPAVTVLLVTRRPHRVVRAVRELAAQTYPELEVVVGLHGVELPAATRVEIAAQSRPVLLVEIPPAANLGEALGEASRYARGSVVTKVDDDDRYGPEHVWDLVLARHYSGATVVGKGAEFVYVEPQDVTVRRRMGAELFTDVVAGGTILLDRGDLEAVGGWSPVDRSVDRALLDRVLAAGGLIYRTHGLGFIYTRHADGHTWQTGLDYFLRDPLRRWSGLPRHEEFGTR